MQRDQLSPKQQSLTYVLATLAYLVLGRLGLSFQTPSVIYPAAGLALAMLLIYGPRLWPAIGAGSLLLNLLMTPQLTWPALPACLGVSVGAALQALTGYFLVQASVGRKNQLLSVKAVSAFLLLGGPVACLVGSSLGPLVLLISGRLATADFISTMITWWAGDSLGVLTMTPILLTLLALPAAPWRRRRLTVALPLLVLYALTAMFFVFIESAHESTTAHEFQILTSTTAHALEQLTDKPQPLPEHPHNLLTAAMRLDGMLKTVPAHPGVHLAIYPPASEVALAETGAEPRPFTLSNASPLQAEHTVQLLGQTLRLKVTSTPDYVVAPASLHLHRWMVASVAIMALLDILLLTITGRDLSARKVEEHSAAETRNVLSSFFDSSPHMMAVFDAGDSDIWYISVNQAAASMLNVPFDILPGKTAREWGMTTAELQLWLGHCSRCKDSGRPVGFDFSYQFPSELRWFSATVTHLGASLPGRDRYSYCVVDITAQKNAERALQNINQLLEQHVEARTRDLRRSEASFRQLADSLPQLIWTANDEGRVDFLNVRWLDYTGSTVAAISSGQARLIHPDEEELLFQRWAQSVVSQTPFEYEYRLKGADGEYRWYLARAVPMPDVDTGKMRWFGCCTDIQENKLRNAELERAKSSLEQAQEERTQLLVNERTALESSRLKSEFLASMSHEIRTPINGVIGMTSLLLDTALNSEQREYGEGIRRSGEALLTVINDILDFSKIEAGRLDFDEIAFPLASTIDDTCLTLMHVARQKGLKFTTNLAEDLPATVRGDPGRLRQILSNLVANGLKFTAAGFVELRATVSQRGREQITVRFEVEDSGIGIKAQAAERLFQPFTQADSSTTRLFGGSGLGLSICKHLVERMGGEIGLTSVEGQGSCFWFTVVLQTSDSALLDQPQSPLAYLHAAAPSAHIARILLAEDVAINRVIAVKMLEKIGYQVHTVGNGKEAVAAIEREDFDLVLMDCHMPEMDGYDATTAIRASLLAKNPLVPIVAMTANAMKGDRERCLGAGMNDYVAKPVAFEALCSVLKRWLSPEAVASTASGESIHAA